MSLTKKFANVAENALKKTQSTQIDAIKTSAGLQMNKTLQAEKTALEDKIAELNAKIAEFESRVEKGEGADTVKDLLAKIDELQKQVGLQEVPLTDIYEKPDAHRRRHLTSEQKEVLKQSLAEFGQIHAIIIEPREEGGFYLIAGHNRVDCLRALGRETARAEVRVSADGDADVAAIISNAVQPEVSTFDLYSAINILKSKGLKQFEVANAIGRSPGFISRLLKLKDTHPVFLEHLKQSGEVLSGAQIDVIARQIKRNSSMEVIQKVIDQLEQMRKKSSELSVEDDSETSAEDEKPAKAKPAKRSTGPREWFSVSAGDKTIQATSRGSVLMINLRTDSRLQKIAPEIEKLIRAALEKEGKSAKG